MLRIMAVSGLKYRGNGSLCPALATYGDAARSDIKAA
jgi:hypothetical protein